MSFWEKVKEFFAQIADNINIDYIFTLIAVLAAFLLGWLLAKIIAKLLEKALKKMNVNHWFNKMLPEEESGKTADIAKIIGNIFFYLLLLIVVLICLNMLGLTSAAEPIKEFVSTITGYLPNLFASMLLLFIAWLVASGLRYLSFAGLQTLKIDEKVTKHINTQGKEAQLSYTLSYVIYWLTFLFFAPTILEALKIEKITNSLAEMLNKVVTYLPNILAAAGIAFVGLFLANIIRKVVTGFLDALKIDVLGEKAGVSKVFAQKSLAKLCGFIAYILIALPVVIVALNALQVETLSGSLGKFLDKILDASGNIFGAGLFIFVCYIAGAFVAGLVAQLLEDFGFNKLMSAIGWGGSEEKGFTASKIAGKLVLVAILFLAAISAADIMGFTDLSRILSDFIPFAGNVLLGIVIFIVGMFLANLAAEAIKTKNFGSQVFIVLVKIIVLVFAGAVALHRMDIGGRIVEITLAIVLGAVGVGAAAAFALAFGLGGKDFAAKKLNEWNEKFSKKG